MYSTSYSFSTNISRFIRKIGARSIFVCFRQTTLLRYENNFVWRRYKIVADWTFGWRKLVFNPNRARTNIAIRSVRRTGGKGIHIMHKGI